MRNLIKPTKKYFLPFIVSAISSTAGFFTVGLLSTFIMFGGGSKLLVTIFDCFCFGVYFIFVLILTRYFSKERPFWPLLFVIILPAIIFWSFIFLSRKVIDQYYEWEDKKDLETISMLLQNTEFQEISCETEATERSVDLSCVLMANFSYELNEDILHRTFKFRLKDDKFTRESVYLIVPNCKKTSRAFTHLTNDFDDSGLQYRKYQPGVHPVYLSWSFIGPECKKENLKALIGQELVIRTASDKIYDSITINSISGL